MATKIDGHQAERRRTGGGVTLLHDQLTPRMLFGGSVTLAGVFIVLLREKRLIDTGT